MFEYRVRITRQTQKHFLADGDRADYELGRINLAKLELLPLVGREMKIYIVEPGKKVVVVDE